MSVAKTQPTVHQALHGMSVEFQRGFELGQVYTFIQSQPQDFTVTVHHDNY